MTATRIDDLCALLDELSKFEFNLNSYYEGDIGHVVDRVLSGKIRALHAFCTAFGWSDLVEMTQDMRVVEGDAVEHMETINNFIEPEARRRIEAIETDRHFGLPQDLWQIIHPRIRSLAEPRFRASHFGDAVEASFKEINIAVKRIVTDATGEELDGANLMKKALSANNPIIRLSAMQNETDRSIQVGYMEIMAGSMTGIRNPNAHGNLNPDFKTAFHLVCLASHLMYKIDERL